MVRTCKHPCMCVCMSVCESMMCPGANKNIYRNHSVWETHLFTLIQQVAPDVRDSPLYTDTASGVWRHKTLIYPCTDTR